MLTVRDLTVRYGRTPAVENLSLEVGKARSSASSGRMVRASPRHSQPSWGSCLWRRADDYLGESLVGLAPEAIARRGIGLVLEGRRIFATLTVGENLALGRTANRATRSDTCSRACSTASRSCGRPSACLRECCPEASSTACDRPGADGRAWLLLLDEPPRVAPLLVDQIFDAVAGIGAAG